MATVVGPWSEDLATIAALVTAGLRYRTVRRRIHVGWWQEPAPGVVCRTTGTLTPRQRRLAALLYVGPGAAVSHASAVALWHRTPEPERTIVTAAPGRHPVSTPLVWVRQSARPFRALGIAGVRVTPPARSVLDAALDLRQLADVDALFGRSVQRRLVSVDELAEELLAAPSAGSRLPRHAMSALTAGSHAASEAQLCRLLRRAGVPAPELNAAVETSLGTRYVDALWRVLRRGVEIDGQAFHLDAAAWQADLRRQNVIQSAGVVLLRIAARRLWTEPDAVVTEIRAFLAAGSRQTA
jgi:very-short-patch-repair endonuclease